VPTFPTTPSLPAFGPVQQSERIETLDILRGFALFAILVVNWTADSPGPRGLASAADWIAYWPIQFLLQEKAWPVFAFLFGLGFAIQMQRAEARGSHFVSVYAKRLLVLFLIGAAHFMLAERDIVHRYAICGLLLLPVRRLHPKLLVVLALLCVLVAWTNRSQIYFRSASPQTAQELAEVTGRAAANRARAAERNRAYASGTFGQVVSVRARDLGAELSSWNRFNWLGDPFAPFLLGLYAGRRRVFQEVAKHREFLRTVMWWTLGFGLAGNTVFWGLEFVYDLGGGITGRPEQLVRLVERLSSPTMGLAYIAALTLLLERGAWKERLAPIASVGRMCLTNYLLQSLVWVLLFNKYGLGWLGQVNLFNRAMLSILVFVVHIVTSQWWMRRFRFGPVEWLWRSLTYGRFQPMLVQKILVAPTEP